MKKNFLLSLSIFIVAILRASQPVKIAVMADVHFMSDKLLGNETGKALYEKFSGRNTVDLHAALDKVLSDIETYKPHILLLPGDMTNHGERLSHIDFIAKLEPLRRKGVRIFAIPGNHDVNIPDAHSFTDGLKQRTGSVSATEFAELYAHFGYAGALRRDSASLSYLSEINENTWLLCLDSNRWSEYRTSSISGGRILAQTLSWALEILREAKEKNITVLGMMHHGLVEHLPYQATFFADYLIDRWKETAETLAQAGLQVVFTGHFHANDITQFTSQKGNVLYDVETGSLSQYPFPYRLITFDGESLSINTHFIDSIPGIPDLQEKYRIKMASFLRRITGIKLQKMDIPLSEETLRALSDLLIHVHILHARGDEEIDEETRRLIGEFSTVLGNHTSDIESFQLDFPPKDNELSIKMKRITNKDVNK